MLNERLTFFLSSLHNGIFSVIFCILVLHSGVATKSNRPISDAIRGSLDILYCSVLVNRCMFLR